MAVESDKITFRHFLNFLLPVLSFIGYNTGTKRVVFIAFGFVMLFTCLSMLILCLFFFKNILTLEMMTFNTFFSANLLVCCSKCYGLVVFRCKFEKMIHYFINNFDMDSKSHTTIKKTIRLSKTWIYILFTTNFIILASTLIYPIISRQTDRPILPMANSYQITRYYTIEFILQSFGYFCSAVVASMFDSLYIASCLFMSEQIEILMRDIAGIECEIKSDCDLVRQQLIKVLEKQSTIIRANTYLNNAFNHILFIQLLVSTVGICAAMVHSNKLTTLLIVPCELQQIIIFCYFGQKIQDKSHSLPDAFYATPWINMKPRERKLLLMGLRQSQKPLCSKAGPIRNMSHETLRAVFQTAYSIYAVLKEIDR